MRRTLLGIKEGQVKSRDGIDADWILKMPESLRVSFLQGVADGDGFVSNGETIGISTKNHQIFYESLLESLSIHATCQRHSVNIARKKSILRAFEIGFFKLASSRRIELENLATMTLSPRAGRLTDEEKKLISRLRKAGNPWTAIRLELWRQLGIVRCSRTIKRSAELYDLG
jgi:hypothetical protein